MVITNIEKSLDNTGKIAIKTKDGFIIEAVLLVDKTERNTACISSQAGCAQGCRFCCTGQMGFSRNLTSEEIVLQYYLLKEAFQKEITNIVFMGMGEPLCNTENVLQAVKVFTDPKGLNIFLRRITISTSGIIPGIKRVLKEKPVPGLALSLITASQELRKKIMPLSPSLAELKEIVKTYNREANKRVILEVVLFHKLNTSEEEIEMLREFCDGLDYYINIIPWNTVGNTEFKTPDEREIQFFADRLKELKMPVSIRHTKGSDINSACGQLGVTAHKIRKATHRN